ncbi:hypothetical protein [Leeuwenhoekiella nanhaiensis]|uniref:Uncharacterized protein n=1 Tax=Leeuwenhoekiella nanhaiensis TaxID=1655491 RepID=A0A2G1VMC3_9FLAO|nr:hypothetical protein [Leeuwenhoekiella nanhaiensis]PHQ27874.1 hypothetical protein CJ305_17875 [Leeuwenhoekiella nanhaiensis]
MKPVNNKSFNAFLFGQMDKLDNDQIDVEKAKAQAGLAKQVNNSFRYELDRAEVQMKLAKHNAIYKDGLRLREVESKNFD